MLNKKSKQILIGIFIALLVLPSIIWQVSGFFIGNKETFNQIFVTDLGENRRLKSKPATFSNAYGAEYDAYYNDNLPFRSNIILLNRDIDKILKTPFNDIKNKIAATLYGSSFEQNEEPIIELTEEEKFYNKYIGDVDYEAFPFLKDDIATPDPGYLEPQIANKCTIIGKNNWLFYALDNYLDYYQKKNIMSPAEMEAYVNMLIELKQECEKQNKQFIMVVPPNKASVYPEFMPSYEVPSGPNRVEVLRDYVATSSNAKIIYPKEELVMAKKYMNNYKRYDTHYNEIGGYITAKRMLEEIDGTSFPPIASCGVIKAQSSLYDLITVGNLNRIDYNDEYEYVLSYENFPKVVAIESEGDETVHPYIHLMSEAPDERVLCIVGDSFRFYMGNALSHAFKDSYTVHRDYMGNMKEIKEAIRNSDIIVFEVLERFSDFIIKHGEILLCILRGEI